MKLESVHIENFKGVKRFDWSLLDSTGESAGRALLVGDNGSGKTSILQAVALTLSLATGEIDEVAKFRWFGFQAGRLGTLGTPLVQLRVRFSGEELLVAKAIFKDWDEKLRPGSLPIGDFEPRSATISLRNGSVQWDPANTMAQFRGRSYVRDLSAAAPEYRGRLSEVGGVFWFDQFRSIGTQGTNGDDPGDQNVPWNAGVGAVRESLARWDNLHKSLLLKQRELRPGQRDLLGELEAAYNRLFPGTTFVGVEPYGESAESFYFLLKRDGLLYDIAEASSGEQAVFPLLYELVRRSIGRSIIVIDEIEMHLHPPLAQALYNLLPRLAPDCQFLVTTHSEAVADIVPPEEITRIPGGRLCL